jgi:hypothetical protein
LLCHGVTGSGPFYAATSDHFGFHNHQGEIGSWAGNSPNDKGSEQACFHFFPRPEGRLNGNVECGLQKVNLELFDLK